MCLLENGPINFPKWRLQEVSQSWPMWTMRLVYMAVGFDILVTSLQISWNDHSCQKRFITFLQSYLCQLHLIWIYWFMILLIGKLINCGFNFKSFFSTPDFKCWYVCKVFWRIYWARQATLSIWNLWANQINQLVAQLMNLNDRDEDLMIRILTSITMGPVWNKI